MKPVEPLSLYRLGGVGFTVVGTIVVGFALGLLANKFLHAPWAVPLGILLGFIAGMLAMFRQLTR
jgi:F0F1-type ATP synthase assembly protein I